MQYDEETIALLDPEEKFFLVRMVGTEYAHRPTVSLVDSYNGIINDAETYMLFVFDDMRFDIVVKPVNDAYVFAMFGFSNTFQTVNQKNAEFNIFGFSLSKDRLTQKRKHKVCVNNALSECGVRGEFEWGKDIVATIEVHGNKGTVEFSDSPFNISKFSFNIHELVSLLSVVNGHSGIKDI